MSTTTLLIALVLAAILVGLLLIRRTRRHDPSRVDTKLDTTALDTAPPTICIHAQDDPLYGTRVRITMPRDER